MIPYHLRLIEDARKELDAMRERYVLAQAGSDLPTREADVASIARVQLAMRALQGLCQLPDEEE